VSFLVRRIGFYLLAAWASLTLNFFLPRLMPGDPASAMFARLRGQVRPEQIDAMRKAFGLSDAPLPEQYVTYLSHALRGDFGISISSFPTPVIQVIATSLQWTLLLGLVATILGFAVGSLLGVFGAWRRCRSARSRRRRDRSSERCQSSRSERSRSAYAAPRGARWETNTEIDPPATRLCGGLRG